MSKYFYNKPERRFDKKVEPTGGSGVTSVGLSAPSIFSIFGSPITSAGTLGFTLNSQGSNLFLASPDGTAGPPSFRAITATDIAGLAGGGALTFVDSVEVTGAAVTAMEISGLDLDTDKFYLLRTSSKNALGVAVDLRVAFNSDLTAANYQRVNMSVATSVTGGRTSSANDISLGNPAGTTVTGFSFIEKDLNGYTRFFNQLNGGSSITAITMAFRQVGWNSTANVTSVQIYSPTASSLDVGSFIYLYRFSLA